MIHLSYDSFRKSLLSNPQSFKPQNFFSRMSIDVKKYNHLEEKCKNSCSISSSKNIATTFNELKSRITPSYFSKVLTAQTNSLDFSSTVFPAYRFLLSEVLADDWLGIVDWHKFQRDHALHQPLTAYIVHKLLYPEIDDSFFKLISMSIDNTIIGIKEESDLVYLRDYLDKLGYASNISIFEKNKFSDFIWRSLLFETTYIAALFHDIGYPWKLINTLSNKLDPLGLERVPTHDEEDILEMYNERLLYYPLNGYQKLNPGKPVSWKSELLAMTRELIDKTHGFPGAICFLYLNDALRLFPNAGENPLRQFCVDWAAMGIMMHDLSKIYWGNERIPKKPHLRLKLHIDPLSTILTLSDFLQEFSRPHSTFSPKKNSVDLRYDMPCKSTSLDLRGGILYITFTYTDKDAMAKKLLFLEKDQYEYFDPKFGYIDISSLGLSRVNVQVKLEN